MSRAAPYQDIWRQGQVVVSGRRDCAARYDLIAPLLQETFGRGFSVADVGGWDGYFAIRLHEDFDAVALNVDQRAVALEGTGIRHLQLVVTPQTVWQIGRHDAILCLSFLHHLEAWPAVYEALRVQSDLLIVEIPHPDESGGPVIDATQHRFRGIYDRVMADGNVIGGSPPLGSKHLRRPIVAVHNVIRGTVESGTGRATTWMARQRPSAWNALGYMPKPGTLNIGLSSDGRSWLVNTPSVKLPVPIFPDYHPVSLSANGQTVDGHGRLNKYRNTIELVAPVSLRNTLGVNDGAEIVVRLRPQ